MESLKTTFFEDPTYVYVGLGLMTVVFAVLWRQRRGANWMLAMLACPVLAGVVFTVERLVVTDREVIDQECREIAADISAGKFDAADKYLDDDFTSSNTVLGWSVKKLAIDTGKAAVKQYDIGKVSLQGQHTEVANKRAVTNVRSVFSVGDSGRAGLDWELHWVKRPDGWRIIDASYRQPQGM